MNQTAGTHEAGSAQTFREGKYFGEGGGLACIRSIPTGIRGRRKGGLRAPWRNLYNAINGVPEMLRLHKVLARDPVVKIGLLLESDSCRNISEEDA